MNNANSSGSGKALLDIKNVTKWNVETTIGWLQQQQSGEYADCESAFREHKINGRALLMLDEHDLKEVCLFVCLFVCLVYDTEVSLIFCRIQFYSIYFRSANDLKPHH